MTDSTTERNEPSPVAGQVVPAKRVLVRRRVGGSGLPKVTVGPRSTMPGPREIVAGCERMIQHMGLAVDDEICERTSKAASEVIHGTFCRGQARLGLGSPAVQILVRRGFLLRLAADVFPDKIQAARKLISDPDTRRIGVEISNAMSVASNPLCGGFDPDSWSIPSASTLCEVNGWGRDRLVDVALVELECIHRRLVAQVRVLADLGSDELSAASLAAARRTSTTT